MGNANQDRAVAVACGVEVTIYRSEIDGRIVVEITGPENPNDAINGSPAIRVYLNECVIYSGSCRECRESGDTIGNCPHGNDAITG